ncbi:hypothetical protein ATANTOWER_015128 [Ataeniobius toweri]|uniref:Uncharacterized protein n=1 Tax=Ataeniobius toweri TaxID=208326 RepID=A0ABU7AHH7_9TELE|nr:hypothetical protein [Ataeniobius toweri]
MVSRFPVFIYLGVRNYMETVFGAIHVGVSVFTTCMKTNKCCYGISRVFILWFKLVSPTSLLKTLQRKGTK